MTVGWGREFGNGESLGISLTDVESLCSSMESGRDTVTNVCFEFLFDVLLCAP